MQNLRQTVDCTNYPIIEQRARENPTTIPVSYQVPEVPEIGPFTNQKIIVMGLPKTGTTSVAQALSHLGYKVSHNQGDTLNNGRCNVIANTLEFQYPELYEKYPNATWVLTYTANTSAWFDSFAYHIIYHQPQNYKKSHRHWIQKIHRMFHIPDTFTSDLDLGANSTEAHHFVLSHAENYMKYYERYYKNLFRFFMQKRSPTSARIPLIDVRNGDGYEKLKDVVLNGTQVIDRKHAAFPHANSKNNVGGWPRCR